MSLIVYANHFTPPLREYFWQSRAGVFPPVQCYVSRCKYKPNLFETVLTCQSIDELREIRHNSLTWEECMNKRAAEILKLDGKIYVLYSGGVDSVGIVCSIIKNFSTEDLKRVTLLCTPSSVVEFPSFFNLLVKKIKIEYLNTFIEGYTRDGYVVSGMLGDLFFSEPGMTEKAFELGIAREPYKEGMIKLLSFYSEEYGKRLFDWLEPIVDESLYDINSTLDFISWLYFTQLYQKVQLAHLSQKGNFEDLSSYSKVINFFDTLDFQLWGIENHSKITYNSMKDYKRDSKIYINSVFKNDWYLENKQKFPSYFYFMFGTSFIDAIDENWNVIDLETAMDYCRD